MRHLHRYEIASLASLASLIPIALASKFSFAGTTVKFDNIDYFISPNHVGHISTNQCGDKRTSANVSVFGLRPVTIIPPQIASADLEALFTNWTTRDDVFRREFAEECTISSSLLSGPYFVSEATGAVYPIYRLYNDFSQSFTQSLLQNADGSFQTLSAQTSTSGSLTIGVPSRIYATPCKNKPLAGVRVGVKDLYRLKGVKTSNGNRAWYNLYPASNQTSPAIQRLIDAGAVVVGLQTPTQFANGDTYAGDWVDYHSPFNPRGDGYQVTQGSSAGAGASIASYDWLDIAIGSDTGGSVRFPAGVQGIFGNRPTQNLVTLDLVTPLSPSMDTPGIFARDPTLWDTAQSVMYGSNYTSLANVDKVVYPDVIYTLDFPASSSNNTNAAASKLLDRFLAATVNLTGAKVKKINISTLWDASKPKQAENVSLMELLNLTYSVLVSKDQSRLVRDPFFADYAAKYDGRKPYINPSPLSRWKYADSLPESVLTAANANQTLFADWFNKKVLPGTNTDACSSALILYPGAGFATVNRVDLYKGGPSPLPFGLYPSSHSTYAGVPDVVFPIGEAAMLSAITGKDELLPVTVDVIAAKGCDGLLMKLAIDLAARSAVTIPKVGRTLQGGDILM